VPPPISKRVKRAVRSALLRALLIVLSRLPLRPALAAGRLAGWLAWRVLRGERRLVLEHLALAFPEKSAAERRAIGEASLIHLGQVALEIVTLRRRGRRLAEEVAIAPGGEALIRRALARGRGVVFAAGHIGNWELTARRLALVTRAGPGAVIARRGGLPWADEAIQALRAEGGVETLWRDDPSTGRRLIRLLRGGGSLGLLIDQDTRVQGVFVPFFGRLAFTPRAAADLALRFEAPLLAVTSHRRGPRAGAGHEIQVVEVPYDARPADPDREAERITAEATAVHERAIREHPSEWVWMHRRWRNRPPSEASLARPMPKSRELSGT
jgi:KDO2-lipid IV(A) lauroyltransferase